MRRPLESSVARAAFGACLVALFAACSGTTAPVRADTPRVCALPNPIPPPAERYHSGANDGWSGQRPDARDRDVLQRLNQHIASAPSDAEALASRGDVFAQRGLRDRAEADFARANALAPTIARVHWARGWGEFALGDYVCAVAEWQEVADAIGADASWIPHTLAIGYWAAGERDAAIAYYAAAARSFPERFGTREALAATDQYWRGAERATIEQVFAAWRASEAR